MAAPAYAQGDSGEQVQQDPSQNGPDQGEPAQGEPAQGDPEQDQDQSEDDGSDGSEDSEGGEDSDEDLESDGSGLQCQQDSPPASEPMQAGWWAETLQLEELHEQVPEQGEGVTVAVLDTGTWVNEQFLELDRPTPIDLTTGTAQHVEEREGFTWDCDGHGTAVAGLIGAQPLDNPDYPSDMVGVAPNVSLLTVRVTVGRDDGKGQDLADGIRYAVDSGADIINASIEMSSHYTPLEEAVAYAEQNGVLVVTAAGNSEDSAAFPATYAAAYDNVISVGSVAKNGQASEFSSPSSTTIAAPGEEIVTTARDAGHVQEEGTSFAAPLVSGVAALMMNHFGEQITPAEIRDRLVATADPVAGEGADSEVSGAGMINPVAAITAIMDMDAAEKNLEVEPFPGRYEEPPPDRTPRNVALGVAGGSFVLTLAALGALATVRKGRARGWRPGD